MRLDYWICFENLKGKVITSIIGAEKESKEIVFKCETGEKYKMYHHQNCCEYVTVEDIIGDIKNLIGSPIRMAEEVSEVDDNARESGTWTFYKLATAKGYVTIRWYGESNGSYSERVDFVRVG